MQSSLIRCDILMFPRYEDRDVLVINKPVGLVVLWPETRG